MATAVEMRKVCFSKQGLVLAHVLSRMHEHAEQSTAAIHVVSPVYILQEGHTATGISDILS